MQYVSDAFSGKLALPTIARVVRRAMALLRDPSGSIHELTAELARDPVMAARVLRLANSAHYAGRRTLASIDDAVAMVGTQALVTLLVASGLSGAFVEVKGVHLREFWLHSGITAAAARRLARLCGADTEAAYLAGLLHQCGHLILCQAFPEPAQRCFANELTRHGAALAEAEMQAFGAHHGQVGAFWCDSMQLPEPVTEAVAFYLQPALVAQGSLAPIVSLASTLAVAATAEPAAMAGADSAHGADGPLDPAPALSPAQGALVEALGLDPQRFPEGLAEFLDELRQTGEQL